MTNGKIKYFSMFSGVGGFELGFENSRGESSLSEGWNENSRSTQNLQDNRSESWNETRYTCVGFSEIDKYSIQTYKKNFPNHINFGDATKIKPEELPDFDLLCGGFPCQAFSIAGKRRGFEDTRGTLFFEIARILKIKRPKIILLENVKGLLNHNKGETFKVIIQTISELGYEVQWMVFNSKFFGVPQNRERVFIIGSFRGESKPEILPFGENSQEINTDRKSQNSGTIISQYGKIPTDGSYVKSVHSLYPRSSKTNKGGTGHLTKEPNDSYALDTGNQQAIEITGGLQDHASSMLNCSTALTEAMGKGGGHTPIVNKIRRLTPIECERLQGFPDNWTEGVSDTQRYKQMGNAVTVNVIKAIAHKLLQL